VPVRRRALCVLVLLLMLLPVLAAATGEQRHRANAYLYGEYLYEDEIYFPGAIDSGTGAFTVTLIPGVLAKHPEGITAVARSRPAFQISVTVTGQGGGMLLGHADGSRPRDWAVFAFSNAVDLSRSHVVVVQFIAWKLSSVSLDGLPLSLQRSETPPTRTTGEMKT
jgi:hypothetical protein